MMKKRSSAGFTSIGLLVVIAIIIISVGMIYSFWRRANERALETQNLTNVKQIALACLLYANENNGNLPKNLQVLVEKQYITQPAVLISPFADNKAKPSYEIVALSIILSEGEQDTQTSMIREIDANRRGRRAVAYIDGHAELISD